ncbi:MAG: hypothetical protein OXL97_14500 [Chloroflexota bacterium]|nr:hypothetical protein [Chloroflexota bacterium]
MTARMYDKSFVAVSLFDAHIGIRMASTSDVVIESTRMPPMEG